MAFSAAKMPQPEAMTSEVASVFQSASDWSGFQIAMIETDTLSTMQAVITQKAKPRTNLGFRYPLPRRTARGGKAGGGAIAGSELGFVMAGCYCARPEKKV